MHVDSAERHRRRQSPLLTEQAAEGGHGHVGAAAARHGGYGQRPLLLVVQHLSAGRGEAAMWRPGLQEGRHEARLSMMLLVDIVLLTNRKQRRAGPWWFLRLFARDRFSAKTAAARCPGLVSRSRNSARTAALHPRVAPQSLVTGGPGLGNPREGWVLKVTLYCPGQGTDIKNASDAFQDSIWRRLTQRWDRPAGVFKRRNDVF